MPRIVITGFGTINALGTGVEAFEASLRAGRCGVGELSLFSSEGYRTSLAAEVKRIEAPARLPARMARRASRTNLLSLVAADEAWRMAGMDAVDVRGGVGVIVGTTTGGLAVGEARLRRDLRGEASRFPMAEWVETPVSVSADAIAAVFSCAGPRLTVSTACSSGANALGIASDWIRQGRASAVVCGGTDSLCRVTYSGFNALQALDARPCRPFDVARAGLTLGEGAAMFVLEEEEHARRRGAAVLGELVGYGVSADAHHLTQPRPDGAGALLAMRRALAAAEVDSEEVDYINAHGTGTPLNDVIETRAIKSLFGSRAARLPVSSTKSAVGHCLGAAGAIEAVASLLAIRGGFVPPTVTLENPDPECDLDYVPKTARPARLRTVLSNSYGFGGNNTSIVLRRLDD